MPAWARLACTPAATDVLISDNDGSTSRTTANYLRYETAGKAATAERCLSR